MKKMLTMVFCALWLVGCGAQEGAKRTFVTIGTGGLTGVYYPVGGAIASLVNGGSSAHGVKASVESTGGSVYNINAVLSGDLDFGMTQADRQYQAVKGLAEWEGRPAENLRAVFSLHPEIVTLVAADEVGVATVADLKGKRVNIGDPGSGNRGNAIDVLTAAGLDWENDVLVEGLKAAEAPTLLQDGRLDAFFYTLGHPSGAIEEATSGRRKVRFVPVTGMDKLVETAPYYSSATIPTDLYPMAVGEKNVESVAVLTTFVTSSAVSADVVYALTKAVFERFEDFKKQHAALARLTKAEMLKGHAAPMHEGAARYYREQGLLK